MHVLKTILLGLIVVLGSVSLTQAQDMYTNDQGVAIKGYDVVSYHTAHKAMKGSKKYATEYNGTTFYFSSAEHKTAFESNPEKYLPEFGGYCAYAVGAKGKKVPADPETFKFRDGELLLFFNGEMQGKRMNTIIPWVKNEEELLSQAKQKWPKLH